MSRRREYRVSWQRVDSPRHSKRFPTKRRAESYLAAVRAMTPEERYGDKVDKPMHPGCGGGYGDPPCSKCEGRTWREDWELRFMGGGTLELKPLVFSKLDSRPLPDWEDEPAEPVVEFRFGDVLQPKAKHQAHRIMVIDDYRAWSLNDFRAPREAMIPYGKHNWRKVE